MDMLWLKSKTTVPQIMSDAVARERLYESLKNRGGPIKITIVRAPAGYGKTTLLSGWLSQLNDLVAWMSIDAADNDPIRFWKYVVHTVSESSQSNIDTTLSSLYNSQDSSTFEFLIDSFLNELSLIKKTIHIVLDDYHLIENDTIHRMMKQFIENLPTNVQIYMTSREELPLPLAKWRMKSWLKDISIDDLRFTFEESKHFYKNDPLLYNDSKFLQNAWEMTEGWAAGLQLAGLSLNTTTPDLIDVTHPFITDFLIQEILATLPPSTQDFLIRTSILNSLEPEVCNALTNRSDSYDILLDLERKGFFIVRLHSSQPIFRYHHLFAEALQVELRKRYSQEQTASIITEVATLIRQRGDYITAIELVLTEQNYHLAETWITAHLVELFNSGQTSSFIRWVRFFRTHNHPVPHEMLVMDIIALVSRLEIEEAAQLMGELEFRQLTEKWMDKSENLGIADIYEGVKAYALLGMGEDIEKIEEIIRKRLEKGPVTSRWDNIPMRFNLFEPSLLRTSLGAQGKIPSLEKSIPFIKLFRETQYKEESITAYSYGLSAESLYERNYLDAAYTELELALKLGHQFKDPGLFVPMYLLKSYIYGMKKQFVTAQATLSHAMEQVKEKHWISSLHTMKARCYLLEGNLLKAESELYTIQSKQPFWLLTKSRLIFAKGQIEEALTIIIGVKMKALQEGQISTLIEASSLEAICEMKLGNEESALTVLHEALEQGAPYGYARTFLDEEELIPLMELYLKKRKSNAASQWTSVPLSYIEQLLEKEPGEESVLNLLTPREQEVFTLLKDGATNREIAEHLALTEGTVRVYLTTIYSKLGVNSRAKAILLN